MTEEYYDEQENTIDETNDYNIAIKKAIISFIFIFGPVSLTIDLLFPITTAWFFVDLTIYFTVFTILFVILFFTESYLKAQKFKKEKISGI